MLSPVLMLVYIAGFCGLFAGMWARAWRRENSPRLVRIWPPWRRTMRRLAWTLWRGRERKSKRSTNVSDAPVIAVICQFLFFFVSCSFSQSSSYTHELLYFRLSSDSLYSVVVPDLYQFFFTSFILFDVTTYQGFVLGSGRSNMVAITATVTICKSQK